MDDRLHDALTWVSHNRYLSAALTISAVLVIAVSVGCQATAPSPLDGKPVTAAQLEGQQASEQARIKAALAKAEAERVAAEKALKASLEGDLAELNARAEAIRRRADANAGAIAEAYTVRIAELDAEVAGLDARFAAAATDITEKNQRINGWIGAGVDVVNAVAPQFGGIAAIIGGLLAGGTIVDNRRKDKVIASAMGKLTPAT